MRRKIRFFSVLFVLLLLMVGCVDEVELKEDPKKEVQVEKKGSIAPVVKDVKLTIKDYLPFKKDTLYEYKGEGNEFAAQSSYLEFIDGNKAQMKIFNSGTNVIKILEYRENELIESFVEGETYYIENKIDTEMKDESIILKEPLVVGTEWKSNGNKKTIKAVDKILDLPYGKLKALEVVTDLGESRKQYDYYSKNLGHVATIYKDGDFEVKTLLNKIHKGAIDKKLKYYYPLDDGTGMIYKDRKLSFKTNNDMKKLIEKFMEDPENQTLVPLISKDTEIKDISLDKTNNVLYVNFNKELLNYTTGMGSFFEGEIIQGIVNTLGEYYLTDKVVISVEDKLYESGHFILEEGDFFEKTDDAIELVD